MRFPHTHHTRTFPAFTEYCYGSRPVKRGLILPIINELYSNKLFQMCANPFCLLGISEKSRAVALMWSSGGFLVFV